MVRSYSLLILFILLLTACGGTPTPGTSSTPLPVAEIPANLPTTVSHGPTDAPTVTPIPVQLLLYESGNEISILDLNTRGESVLIRNMKVDGWSISPTGTRLVYKLHAPLYGPNYLLDLTTGQVTGNFPYEPGLIHWHPLGEALVGYNRDKKDWELFRVADGKVVAEGEFGTFSPDGTKMAYFSGQELHICDVLLDARGQVTGVNRTCKIADLPLGERIHPDSIRWSPAGDRLAFGAQELHGNPINPTFIYAVNLDGSGLVKLTDSTTLEPGKTMIIQTVAGTPNGAMVYFSWSLDGEKLAFAAEIFLAPEKVTTMPQVYVVDGNGDNLVKLTGESLFPIGENPVWTPDGKLLVQSGNVYGQDNLSYYSNKMVLTDARGIRKEIVEDNAFIFMPPFFLPAGAEENFSRLMEEPFIFSCATGWTGLEIGTTAVVTPGASNWVRSEPRRGNNQVSRLLAGSVVEILEGPLCVDGLVFWRVGADSIPGGSGWTAEGDGLEHWLEPQEP